MHTHCIRQFEQSQGGTTHGKAKDGEDLPLGQDHPAGGIYAGKHSRLVRKDLQPFPLSTSAHKA